MGTGAGTVAAGDDGRFTDERTPLNNSVTSAKIVDGTIVSADIANSSITLNKLNQDSASTGQVIKWNGSAWVASSDESGAGGTVTSVTASGPLVSSGGGTPNISLARSNGTTDGYLASTDWSIFNNKLSDFSTMTSADVISALTFTPSTNVLPSGNIFVGNGSNVATSVTMSGDAAISNTGNITLTNSATTRNNLGLGTSAVYNVPVAGDAGAGEVVKGDDSRLIDARTPIDNSVTSAKIVDGTITSADLSSSLLDGVWAANVSGDVYRSTGKVGVGTSNPMTLLSIGSGGGTPRDGAADVPVFISQPGNAGFGAKNSSTNVEFAAGVYDGYAYAGSVRNQDFLLVSNDLARLTIQSTGDLIVNTGKLGIGVNPVYAVDVSGDVNVTGVFRVNGTPIGSGTVTSVTASGPLASSGGATPNITLARSNGTTDGYLASTDWSIFNNKLSDFSTMTSADVISALTFTPATSTLTDGYIFVGNGSNVATGVEVSGDATISNTGVVTLTNSSTARFNLGLGTAAEFNIPAAGDAGVAEVLTGADSRLTDPRVPIDNSVTSAKIVDGTIISADIANSSITLNKLNQDSASTGQVIKWNGSAWVASSDESGAGGTVTSVTASGPLVSSGGGTPNITLARSNGTTDGYLASTDWSIFNNKLSDFSTMTSADVISALTFTPATSALTNGNIFVGNGSNVATSVTMSGDATISNTGSVTLSNSATTRTNLGLGTSSVLNVPVAGDAGAGEVVKGDDSRLVDNRTPIDNSVTSAKILDGTITSADLSSSLLDGVWSANVSGDAYRSSGNVGIGTSNPSSKLQVDGGDAVINSVRVGRGVGNNDRNAVLGRLALNANTTGDEIVAIGTSALALNTSGYSNTAIGYATLSSNTTGNRNVAIGRAAMSNTTTGFSNVAIGYQSMILSGAGSYNVAVGDRANERGTGSHNIAVGADAYSNPSATGSYNLILGYNAGSNLTTGSSNILIGDGISATTATSVGEINIGGVYRGDRSNLIADINRVINLRGGSEPGVSPTGQGRLYFDSASNTFKASQNGGAYYDILTSASGVITTVTASSPLVSSGGTTPNITLARSNGTTDGYLASTDWTIFNNKLSDFSTLTSSDIVSALTFTPATNSLSSGNILVGNVSHIATSVTMSGDATISNTGNITLTNSATTRTNLGLGLAAVYNVPVAGDAGITELVRGDDSRLIDARAPIDNSVTSAKIVDGTIVSADISNSTITLNKLNQDSASTGQVIKWNGSVWVASSDVTGMSSVTSSDINTALGYTPGNPVNYVLKAGDTMTGALNLPSNGLVVGTNQIVVSGGNVGIGTTTPFSKLSLATEPVSHAADDVTAGSVTNNPSFGANFVSAKARGTMMAPSAVLSGDNLGGVYGVGFDGATFTNTGSYIQFQSESDFSSTVSTSMRFGTTNAGFESEKMRITPAGNVGIGETAPAYALDVLGDVNVSGVFRIGGVPIGAGISTLDGLTDSITNYANNSMFLGTNSGAAYVSGNDNTALGEGTLSAGATSMDGNTAVGYNALRDNESGLNTAVGAYALLLNSAGYNNTAVGHTALQSVTTQFDNVAVGAFAGEYVVSSGNVAIGAAALQYHNGANGGNIAIGRRSLQNTTGLDNVGIGAQAGDNITTGNYNIIIGANIDAPAATADYQLNIGDLIYGNMTSTSRMVDVNGAITSRPFGTATGQTGQIILRELATNGVHTMTVRAPDAITANRFFTFPDSSGSTGAILTSTAATGATSWATSIQIAGDIRSSGGDVRAGDDLRSDNTLTVNGASTLTGVVTVGAQTRFVDGTASAPGISFSSDTNTGIYRVGIDTIGFTNNGVQSMSLSTSGDLTITGDGIKPGGGTWTATSDIRLKDVHGSYQKGLQDILKINPITFNYKKDNIRREPSNIEFVGVSAQDYKKVFPESVKMEKDGYYSVNNSSLIYAVVNAIKELFLEVINLKKEVQKIITELNNKNSVVEIEALRKENTELKMRLEQFEKRLEKIENK